MLKRQIRFLIDKFDLKLGDGELYVQAFTHASYRNERGLNYDYQRLELLGDSVIQLIVTKYLYDKFPKASEGEMTDLRRKFVKGDTQLKVSDTLHLLDCCYLGNGMNSEKDFKKVKEDIFESFFGAIYLSQGMEKSADILKQTLIEYVEENKILEYEDDYKSRFQEIIQRREYQKGDKSKNKIQYLEIRKESNTKFNVELKFDGITFGIGSGDKKLEAEQNAAKDAISRLAKK